MCEYYEKRSNINSETESALYLILDLEHMTSVIESSSGGAKKRKVRRHVACELKIYTDPKSLALHSHILPEVSLRGWVNTSCRPMRHLLR